MNAIRRLLPLALLLALLSGVALAQDAAQLSKAALMRALASRVYTNANFTVLASNLAPDFVWRRAGDAVIDMADWRAEVQALADALPDLDADVLFRLTDGDWAAHLVHMRGTFDAPLRWGGETRPPTGDRVEWLQLDIVHFGGGRAVTGYTERATDALLAQFPATDGSRPPRSPVAAASAGAAVQAGPAAPVAPVSAAISRAQERRYGESLRTLLATLTRPDAVAFAALLSDDVRVYTPDAVLDRDAFTQWAGRLIVAMPDLVLDIPAALVGGRTGVARLAVSGTFYGQWADEGEEPLFGSGQPLALTANVLARFDDDGQINALWWLYDPADWAAQFAAAPVDASTP